MSNQPFLTLAQIDEVTAAVRAQTKYEPKLAIVLGSGLGSLADAIENADVIPYASLPHWPKSTVHGHAGRLVIGMLQGQLIMAMQGRIHYYEGYSMSQVTLPVRVMQRLGVETYVVTNAAGAINSTFEPGDLMLITDHLNMAGMVGLNPLIGPNLDEFGTRFPDMSQAYDRKLQEVARQAARQAGIQLREGVYVGLSGPSFETPADMRFLKICGADAVGMSTVPEVTVARHGGMRVLGISGISNKANLEGNEPTTHEEVLEAGLSMGPKLERLIRIILPSLQV